MKNHISKAGRALAVLIVAVFLFSAMTSIVPEAKPVKDASAAPATEVKVGWMSQIQNWNPMNIEMVEDYVACYLMFSSLFTYDQDWNQVVNDLATGYSQVVNPNGTMMTTIDITNHAYFRNALNPTSTSNQLTASDVKYTFDRIIATPGGAWDTYLFNISSIQVISPTRLTILTDFPKSTLISDLSGIPIIPQYQWSGIASNKFLSQMKPSDLVGSGPFYYTDSTNTWYRFTTALNYHGATDYPGVRNVKIASILYTVYGDPGGMTLAMNSGVEDTIVLSGQPDLYRSTLGNGASVNVIKSAVQEGGICDIAINAIPVEFRQTSGGGYGQGNPLLLDPVVRKAIMMTLNKTDIVDNLLFGMALRAESVIQPGPWHKDMIPPTPFDQLAAKALLQANGYWDQDSDGWLEANSTAYPVVMGWANAGAELNFRLHAPNNEPSYMAVGQSWDRWAAVAGINFQYQALQESVMNNFDWYKADYDVWVWHWGWGPEPLSTLSVWLTEEIMPSGDNCQMPMGPWYFNEANSSTGKAYSAFDENWSLAQRTIDPIAKKAIIDELQQMVYDSYTENPPFYDLGLYGYTDQRFLGWGDWVAHPGRTTASDLLWLWFDLESVVNQAPMFDAPLNPTYSPIVNTLQTFQVQVHDVDDDALWVNWTFGDGSPVAHDIVPAGTSASPVTLTRTHTYTVLNPTGYSMTVTLTDGEAGHEKTSTTTVYVVERPDFPPSPTSAVDYSPRTSAYNDTIVSWFWNASDAESGGSTGFGLRYTWDWGDGTYTVHNHQPTVNNTPVAESATHAWTIGLTYDVQVWVWDGEPNTLVHNVSSGVIPYTVIENTPPSAAIISSISGTEGTLIDCVATSVDADSDQLRFTWVWDDGTYTVTNHAGSPGQVASMVQHTWPVTGAPMTYPVTVWVSDRTGYTGHNVSASISATISPSGVNVAPTALLVVPPPTPAYINTNLTFNASAIDTDGDTLEFYFEFGDGGSAIATLPSGATTRRYVNFSHNYTAPSLYTVTLWVNDLTGPADHNVTTTANLDVTANEAPWVLLPSSLTAGYNRTFTVTPSQCVDNDSDPLQVWYDWGDGTPMTQGGAPASSFAASHNYTSLGNKTLTIYVNDGTGLSGHNVTKNATVRVIEANLKPEIVGVIAKTPSKNEYLPNETITFTIVVKDFEGDNLTLTVEFGDGAKEIVMILGVPTNAADTNITSNVTHLFTAGRIDPYRVNATVNDGMDHSDMNWSIGHTSVQVTAPTPPSKPKEGLPLALIGGIAIAAIAALLVIFFLLKRRKKEGAEKGAPGGMEGMTPPPPPPPAT